MRSWQRFVACVTLQCLVGGAKADDAAPLSALAKMPVKEITVFKDGHAFVLHAGKMPTDANGDVQMDYLPTPVLGTFWTYSADKNVKLASVTASQHRVLIDHTAMTPREMITANIGAEVSVEDNYGKTFDGQLLSIPTRSSAEAAATEPPNSNERLPVKSDWFLFKTTDGVRLMSFDQVRNVTFKGAYKTRVSNEDFRNLLTLKLAWPNNQPAKTADVGMIYVQKGVRWIPEYKMTLDGKGGATVKLQANLINELTDLNDVTANLVIGVPYFAFQDTPDPVSLQAAFAQLSSYFSTDVLGPDPQRMLRSQINLTTGSSLPNDFPVQLGDIPAIGALGREPSPGVAGTEQKEDLFVFTVKHLTLKKGERSIIPIAEYTVKYQDVYTLSIPVTPPKEILTVGNNANVALSQGQFAPIVLHKLRFTNSGKQPFTTAPILITEGDRVLAQSLMPYTAVGAETDLILTTATDIKVKKKDSETKRTPDAAQWQKESYGRVDLAGTISLTNYGAKKIRMEVTRNVLGNVDKADNGGVTEMVNVLENDSLSQRPVTYYGYSWPDWWTHFNGVGRITWKIDLDAGKSVDLGYTWHYFWR